MSDRKDGLFIRGDGRLDFEVIGKEKTFRSLLDRLSEKQENVNGTHRREGFAIKRQNHDTIYPACISQLDIDQLGHKYRRSHYAIIVADPDAKFDEELDLSSLYGLSKSEASILSGLVIGKTIEQIAETRRTKPSTVRTTLKNACRKLGVSRQQDIIRLVLSGPHGVYNGALQLGE
nr:helix-turn-helix transcriptional regulator [Pseudemcibacter aquimaris]